MSIGMKLLDGACAVIGDKNRAIIGHCKAVWLATEATEKGLLTIGVDTGHASASIRNPEGSVGFGEDRFRTYKIMAGVGLLAQVESELFDGNGGVTHWFVLSY